MALQTHSIAIATAGCHADVTAMTVPILGTVIVQKIVGVVSI